jgi:hypothetical protein
VIADVPAAVAERIRLGCPNFERDGGWEVNVVLDMNVLASSNSSGGDIARDS